MYKTSTHFHYVNYSFLQLLSLWSFNFLIKVLPKLYEWVFGYCVNLTCRLTLLQILSFLYIFHVNKFSIAC